MALTRENYPHGVEGSEEQEEMPNSLHLEELGLLQLLERISEQAGGAIDRFSRYGLVQGGLITDTDPPMLTELGRDRLAELRIAREARELDGDVSPA